MFCRILHSLQQSAVLPETFPPTWTPMATPSPKPRLMLIYCPKAPWPVTTWATDPRPNAWKNRRDAIKKKQITGDFQAVQFREIIPQIMRIWVSNECFVINRLVICSANDSVRKLSKGLKKHLTPNKCLIRKQETCDFSFKRNVYLGERWVSKSNLYSICLCLLMLIYMSCSGCHAYSSIYRS